MPPEGDRGRTGGLLRVAGRPADLPLLAAGRRTDRTLARYRHRRGWPASDRRPHHNWDGLVRAFWIFVHLLAGVLWIGGGLAAMFVSLAAKKMGRAEQGVAARLVASVYARMIAPGAGAMVLSGLFLIMTY